MWKKRYIVSIALLFISTQGYPEANNSFQNALDQYYSMSSAEIVDQWTKGFAERKKKSQTEENEARCDHLLAAEKGDGIVTLLGLIGYAAQFSHGAISRGMGDAVMTNASYYHRPR